MPPPALPGSIGSRPVPFRGTGRVLWFAALPAGRVGEGGWVVLDVAVAVVALAGYWRLDGVGGEEAPGFGVVDAAFHVDEAVFVVVFVAGVALPGPVAPAVA